MKAKPIVENKFWILEEDDGARVGTIALKTNKAVVSIGNKTHTFSDLDEVKETFNVSFNKKITQISSEAEDMEVYNFPTAHVPHNALWHVERKFPIYTKTVKSSNYHCAGYYIIKFKHGWAKAFCPKLITLQRYEYVGPFKNKMEVTEQLRLYNNEHI